MKFDISLYSNTKSLTSVRQMANLHKSGNKLCYKFDHGTKEDFAKQESTRGSAHRLAQARVQHCEHARGAEVPDLASRSHRIEMNPSIPTQTFDALL